MLYDFFIGPFVEFPFMKRALVGGIAISIGAAPIGVFLTTAVRNPEVREILPQTTVALRDWNGQATPGEEVFAALAADLARAKQNNTAATLGKRLNYESAGMRSRIMSVARKLDDFAAGPLAPQFAAIDAAWGQPAIWAIIQRNAAPVTPYYLLTAIDLGQDASGGIARVAPVSSTTTSASRPVSKLPIR